MVTVSIRYHEDATPWRALHIMHIFASHVSVQRRLEICRPYIAESYEWQSFVMPDYDSAFVLIDKLAYDAGYSVKIDREKVRV